MSIDLSPLKKKNNPIQITPDKTKTIPVAKVKQPPTNKTTTKKYESDALSIDSYIDDIPNYKDDIDDVTEVVALTQNQRDKTVALCNLIISEFPDKLKQYKNKDLHKLSDEELLDFKQNLHREITTSSSLGMLTEQSKKALEFYEYIMCNYLDINVKGVSNLGDSQEYKDTVKAVLIKYLDDSLISVVEPEYKLAYLIISSSLLAHANNTIESANKLEQPIQSDIPVVKTINTTKVTAASSGSHQPPKPSEPKYIDPDAAIINTLKMNQINYEYSDL